MSGKISSALVSSTLSQVFDSQEREVTYYTATKTTSPIGGQPAYSYSTTTKKLVIQRKGKNFTLDKEGLFESADVKVWCRPTVTIAKDDRFVVDSETYVIQNTVQRQFGGTHVFTIAGAVKVN